MNDYELFLRSDLVLKLDQEICESLSARLYREKIDLLTTFLKAEIEASELSIDEIESVLKTNSDLVVSFTISHLRKLFDDPPLLSTGVSITHAIYIVYLGKENNKELLDYIARRRIPKRKKVLQELLDAYSSLNIKPEQPEEL